MKASNAKPLGGARTGLNPLPDRVQQGAPADIEGFLLSLAILCGVAEDDAQAAVNAFFAHILEVSEPDALTDADAQEFFESRVARAKTSRGEKTKDGREPTLADFAKRITNSGTTGSD